MPWWAILAVAWCVFLLLVVAFGVGFEERRKRTGQRRR